MPNNDLQPVELPCVVLFDVDGTLLFGARRGPTAGVLSMNEAVLEVAGRGPEYKAVDFAGRTDVQIARSLLEVAGLADPTREQVAATVELYLAGMERHVGERPYTAIGDPAAAVRALNARGATVALGTGNVRRGAEIKLESAGLTGLFDITRGGYGDDGDTRDQVIETGARRSDPSRELPVVVIGDTPHDVAAARAIGAACIATPFGNNDAETLLAVGADVIVERLDAALASVVEELLARTDR